MSIALKYQNAADQTTGERTLQAAEPVIDGVLRASALSAVAVFSPPLTFITSIFVEATTVMVPARLIPQHLYRNRKTASYDCRGRREF